MGRISENDNLSRVLYSVIPELVPLYFLDFFVYFRLHIQSKNLELVSIGNNNQEVFVFLCWGPWEDWVGKIGTRVRRLSTHTGISQR